MIIGIPKEIMTNENRVAALPETVEKFKLLGIDVLVETTAGEGAFASDDMYAASGAIIAQDAAEVFNGSGVILKVTEPLFNEANNTHEIDMLRQGQMLVTFLYPAAPSNQDGIRRLVEKKVTAFTMDGIPRISRARCMDPLTSTRPCHASWLYADTLYYFIEDLFKYSTVSDLDLTHDTITHCLVTHEGALYQKGVRKAVGLDA